MSSNAEGYSIFEISKNIWCFQLNEGNPFFGTFKEVVLHAVVVHGLKMKEIELAVHTMIQEGHDSAHFGMWGTFMFSFVRKYDRKVS